MEVVNEMVASSDRIPRDAFPELPILWNRDAIIRNNVRTRGSLYIDDVAFIFDLNKIGWSSSDLEFHIRVKRNARYDSVTIRNRIFYTRIAR